MALKLSELQTNAEVLSQELRDPQFRAEWERLTLARAVGECVARYRAAHSLSQHKLAMQLGLRQPAIARLEAGLHEPSLGTLRLLSNKCGIQFQIGIGPSWADWVTQKPREASFWEEAELSTGTRITVASRYLGNAE